MEAVKVIQPRYHLPFVNRARVKEALSQYIRKNLSIGSEINEKNGPGIYFQPRFRFSASDCETVSHFLPFFIPKIFFKLAWLLNLCSSFLFVSHAELEQLGYLEHAFCRRLRMQGSPCLSGVSLRAVLFNI